jgi:hypothetical protein
MTYKVVCKEKSEIIIDPDYPKLVPPLTEKEYQDLKVSIEVDGQHLPITVNEQRILLDGHHRYRACKELKIEPKVEVKSFPSKERDRICKKIIKMKIPRLWLWELVREF